MTAKPTADLNDTEEIVFVIQTLFNDHWIDGMWLIYTATLKRWERDGHRIRDTSKITFTDAAVAREAAKAIKANYPDRVRVIQRNTIVEETLAGEV